MALYEIALRAEKILTEKVVRVDSDNVTSVGEMEDKLLILLDIEKIFGIELVVA